MLHYGKGAKDEKLQLRSLEGLEMYYLLEDKGDGESANGKVKYYRKCEEEETNKFKFITSSERTGRSLDLLSKPCEHDPSYTKKVKQYTTHQTKRTLPVFSVRELSEGKTDSGQA